MLAAGGGLRNTVSCMATKLKKLKVREVSLVPRGANPHARVLLHKGAHRGPTPAWASHLTGERRVSHNPLNRFMDALRGAVTRVAKSDADRAAIEAEFDAAEESLAAEIDAALDEPTEADDAYDAAMRASARDDGTPSEPTGTEGTEMPDESAVLKMFGAANVAELQAKIAKAEQVEQENTRLKGEIERVSKQATESAETVAKMLAEQARVARVEKARTMLGDLPATDERVESLVTVLAKLDAPETEALGKVLKAASDAVEVAKLFEPSRPVRTDGANSANAKLTQIAKQIESAENVAAVVAMQRAMDRNPKLASDAVTEDTVAVRPTS